MLQNIKALHGQKLTAQDGKIGHVADFYFDDKTWYIGELIAETGHWFSGKEILIPTAKIDRISYEDSTVYVNLSFADLEASGGSNPSARFAQS